jgi:hypothetical protein
VPRWRPAPLLAALFAVALSTPPAAADSVRGAVVDAITIQARTDFEATVEVTVGDLVVIALGERHAYLDAIRIELVVGNTLKEYADSFGFTIYSDVQESIATGVQTLTASRQLTQVLPFRNRAHFSIPLSDAGLGLASTTSEVVAPTLSAERFPLLLAVQQLNKGVPDAVFANSFFVRVTPDVASRGSVLFDLVAEGGAPIGAATLLLDDAAIEESASAVDLASGMHEVVVRSEGFSELVTTFTVEPGRHSDVRLELRQPRQRVTFQMPSSTEVVLDGELLQGLTASGVELNAGPHNLILRLGDYSVTREFTVEPGETYSVSLTLDVDIRAE